MSALVVLYKEETESKLYDVDFSAILSAGETLSSSSISVSPSGLTLGSPAINGDGDRIQFRISNGTNGIVYTITILAVTSLSNTLEECVTLSVQTCDWLYTSVNIIRHLIGDLCSPPTYTNARLGELFLVACYQVLSELTFTNTYTISIEGLSISPSPEDSLINLACLKSACIIDTGELRQRARTAGLSIKDSMGTLSVDKGAGDGLTNLIKLGPCKLYEDAKRQFAFGNMDICRAIMTPFSSENVSWSLSWNNNRSRDFS